MITQHDILIAVLASKFLPFHHALYNRFGVFQKISKVLQTAAAVHPLKIGKECRSIPSIPATRPCLAEYLSVFQTEKIMIRISKPVENYNFPLGYQK